MGCGCSCCAEACPPESPLVGTWINVIEAGRLHEPGIHIHRASRGTKAFGNGYLGLNQRPSTSNVLVKLELREDGWICYKFVNLETNFYYFLDTSVISWDNGEMLTKVRVTKPMKYKYVDDSNGEYLLIDGIQLKKLDTPKN